MIDTDKLLGYLVHFLEQRGSPHPSCGMCKDAVRDLAALGITVKVPQ